MAHAPQNPKLPEKFQQSIFFFLRAAIYSFLFFKLKKNYIGVHLISNVVLVSGVQQSDSVIHIYI